MFLTAGGNSRREMLSIRRVLVALCLVAYAWWATTRQPFSATATIAVVAAGLVAVGIGLRHRRPRPTIRMRTGIAIWLALIAALAIWEVAAFEQHPRSQHPTLSSMTNTALTPEPVRAAAFIGWLALGTALAAM